MKRKDAVPLDKVKIELKRDYFAGLWRGDIRPEKWSDVPRSLTKIRDWNKPEFGLFRIGHGNNFSRESTENGDIVKEIDEYRKKINEKYPIRKKIKVASARKAQKLKAKQSQDAIKQADANDIKIANELHRDRQLADLDRRELELEKASKARLEDDIRAKDAEIARLRAQILRPV
ncbi:hypothetical protein GOE08_06600 [Sinorhizobium medicae]|nr:hypothetical protein [Sinorhizobium medicae]MDX1006555.1 hypothetical protein [Sinorhizobium medicae]